ncbi:cytochrome P450 [Actinophytocola sp.]|uniref:cytochrome P450 n=1 Tax=Actinophytocola sp. TaxID=1872138 RepID=UPI002D4E2E57|nr:cytochrome P450 [Actinophytocola sp.]HYQ68828.1 cytochrome P450 [Actinophytocola sp.]
MTHMTELSDFSMERAAGCPFDPAPVFQENLREGRLRRVRLWDGSTPWLVTGYAEQRALLGDPRASAEIDTPGFPNFAEGFGRSGLSFVMMDDPEHNRLRRTVIAQFTVKRVEAMRARVQEIVDDLLDRMLAGPKPADLVEKLALPVPSLVICELLGVPYADHDFFQETSKAILHQESTADERAAAGGALFQYLDTLVEARFADPGEDMLSGLTERIRSGELTRQEATEVGVVMLLAGHETTANMIALGVLALLEHPEQLALLRANLDDPKLVASAVEELLRYLTIAHGGRRRAALEDITIAGQTIRAGEGMILVNETGNRDPAVFAEPDRLDLERNARSHLSFGFGVHQCVGQPLARLELQIVYRTLLHRAPNLGLAAEFGRLPFKHDGFVYGLYELPVTW